MRKVLIAAAAVVVLLVAAGAAVYPSVAGLMPPKFETQVNTVDAATLRNTAQGPVVGFVDLNGAHAWLGIPYAQAPVGELRWRAPQPAQPWSGTREALAFGDMCGQLGSFGGGVLDKEKLGKPVGSEDCLFLNVWAPAFAADAVPQDGQRLPVMVWIHGGGNVVGSSNLYSSARYLPQHGVVVVTINYRMGPLGWFRHPALQGDGVSGEDRSGNYGLLDIIQSLHWVHENIAAFGGDPNRVTVFGESAGGFNVYGLLLSPQAKGLFHGAIAQSGGLRTKATTLGDHYSDDAEPGHERSGPEIVNQLLIADGRAADRAQAKVVQQGMDAAAIRTYLYGKNTADLLNAIRSARGANIMVPALYADGVVVPAEPALQLLADSTRHNAVPFIAGTTRYETKMFNMMGSEFSGRRFGMIPYVKDLDGYIRISGYGSDAWKAFGVDEPLAVMSASNGPAVFGYRFDWDEQQDTWLLKLSELVGAAHATEIDFVFDAARPGAGFMSGFYTEENAAGREPLSAAMSSYWAQFAHTGNPGRGRKGDLPEWQAWGAAQPQFVVFDSAAGGGIRMSGDIVDSEALKQRLLEDRAKGLIASQEQLCRWYGEVFVNSNISGAHADIAGYENFGDGGCKAWPVAQFRGLSEL